MSKQEFIESIAKYVIQYAKDYNIQVHSSIIAQAILESSWGKSEKAKYHNYFGLKYRGNRVTCNNGYFYNGGSEQNADGTYRILGDDEKWYKFDSMEMGVKGYFEFLNVKNYNQIKNVSDPLLYLKLLKNCGYATSIHYVDNVYRVVVDNNLTIYDKGVSMSNSPLVTYVNLSPNCNKPRNHVIDTITIHHMAGNLTIEQCGEIFSKKSRQASSNYGIGSDGRIAMYCEEKNRSWCSSSKSNDNRAITIEVANDGGADKNWHVSDLALKSLIYLCADICKRNNIKELKWQGNKSLIGQIDKQNMTVHRWFSPTKCPGSYLYDKHPYIAVEVNKILSGVIVVKNNPYVEPTRTIYKELKGLTVEETSWLQWELQQSGFYTMKIDGKWGNGTRKAVGLFQTAYPECAGADGKPDYRIGKKSREKLKELK